MTATTDRMPNSAEVARVNKLPTWLIIWRMICFRPWLWLFNLCAMLVLTIAWMTPAFVQREFFNHFTHNAPVHFPDRH
jgi:hypothetical protein